MCENCRHDVPAGVSRPGSAAALSILRVNKEDFSGMNVCVNSLIMTVNGSRKGEEYDEMA